MEWEQLIPSVQVTLWPGPYKDAAPSEGIDSLPSTGNEFSVRVDAGDAPSSVFRFSGDATLSEVWKAIRNL